MDIKRKMYMIEQSDYDEHGNISIYTTKAEAHKQLEWFLNKYVPKKRWHQYSIEAYIVNENLKKKYLKES